MKQSFFSLARADLPLKLSTTICQVQQENFSCRKKILTLTSVTGNHVCLTYRNVYKKLVFELYEIDPDKHRFKLLNSCDISIDEQGPTAIMAINNSCFLVSHFKGVVKNIALISFYGIIAGLW